MSFAREKGARMRKIRLAAVAAAILFAGAAAISQEAAQQSALTPRTMPLACGGKDCTLLGGAHAEAGEVQTAGMRSGFVRLAPGETVGWHTTGAHEEELVILRGKGEAEVEGRSGMPLGEGKIAYIPPETRHNVKNTGTAPLEYVYVVAPVGTAGGK